MKGPIYKLSVDELVASCRFQPHYSGEDSERIWDAVRHPSNDRTLYLLGCALQEVEARFLQALNPGVEHRVRTKVRMERALRRKKRKR